MSMIILNSEFNERYPTVTNGLVCTYPFDGALHCCIDNLKYAKVLSIKNGKDDLYRYFQSKNSSITNSSINIDNEDISINEGQYNLVAIDYDGVISDEIIKKIKTSSSSAKVSVIVKSNNVQQRQFNIGGSFLYIDSYLDEDVIKEAITRSDKTDGYAGCEIYDNYIKLNNGYISTLWDNRIDNFSISFDIHIERSSDIYGLACIANNDTALLSLLYDSKANKIIIKDGMADIETSISNECAISNASKITITKNASNLHIYINDVLNCTCEFNSSTKGNKLTIGKNNMVNVDNSLDARLKNLSIFDRFLNSKDVTILNKGRMIFS